MCGGVLQGQTITITSPNYPNNYNQNRNCAWSVVLPDGENVYVSIEILRNDLLYKVIYSFTE